MIELELKIYTEKIKSNSYHQKFKKPILFYLMHKDDSRNFFCTWIIVDLKNNEIKYLITYTKKNRKLIENHKEKNLFQNLDWKTPHSTILINPEKDFYTFFDQGKYFYYVNLIKKKVRIFTGKDLDCIDSENIIGFGDTVYKDDKNKNIFYFTAKIKKKLDGKDKFFIKYYKSDLLLKNIKNILQTESTKEAWCPHVTRKYKEYLLNSDFTTNEFKLVDSKKNFRNPNELYNYVLSDLYKDIKHHEKILNFLLHAYDYIKKRLYKAMKYIYWQTKKLLQEKRFMNIDELRIFNRETPLKSLSKEESYWIYKYPKKDFMQLCNSIKRYEFITLPGKIMVYNIKKGKKKEYQTTFANPAHFEIDENNDNIYVSSHNWGEIDRLYFFGQAAIDKFKLVKGKLVHKGCFTHPKGYRFTTHKIFNFKNKTYMCTFGQPNRLFFVDTNTMKAIYYEDIGRDYISKVKDIRSFITYTYLEKDVLKTMEISNNGRYIILIGYTYFYIYDFQEKKIKDKIRYNEKKHLFEGIYLNEFNKKTSHCQYID